MTNRLAQENSPYLLQHALNPVDWYPWGQEAFEKAKQDQKPIFLSVGYSTCHWCHVMERESFESDDIADILNRHFVAIKVDREERPDIDHVYMTFVQATTGSGGWPMSVFLTPQLAPFFGGTYFPPDARYGSPGFRQILLGIAREWRDDPVRIATSAARVIQALESVARTTAGTASVKPDALHKCYKYFASSFDRIHGGFEGAPKFPRPVVFNFLLRYHARSGQEAALTTTLETLQKMARGGIHDHLGGGFHRYSVDEAWHVPHFEKMLYDQAQLVTAYAETCQVTGHQDLARVVEDIVQYVARDLRAPEGAFYSAEDADSIIDPDHPHEKGEGAFYVWTADEVRQSLPPPEYDLFARCYDVQPDGNVLHDPHREFVDQNILREVAPVEDLARASHLSPDEVRDRLGHARHILFERRQGRPRPGLDDKILTCWNGMMVSALARASEVLGNPSYLQMAEEAAHFIWKTMRSSGTGELSRRYRKGSVGIEAQHDDYAHTILSLIDLYQASLDIEWLRRAVQLQEKQDELFWSSDDGAYFDTTGRDPSVLLRSRSDYDGAEPSPNSVSALNLLRLAAFTDRAEWRQQAERIVNGLADRTAAAIPNLLVAADFLLAEPIQLVIAGDPPASDTQALLKVIRSHFLPHRILMLADGGPAQQQLAAWLPYLATVKPHNNQATVYLCEHRTCRQPLTDPEELDQLLKELSSPRVSKSR